MDRRTLIVSVVAAVVAAQILFDGVDETPDNTMSDLFLESKAGVCIDLARQALGRSKDQVIEDHAFDLMHLPNHVVVRMANRTGCVKHLNAFRTAIRTYKAQPTV